MSFARRDSHRDMTERDRSLEPFDAPIGSWATEATHPAVEAVVPGTVTFEWLEGGQAANRFGWFGRAERTHDRRITVPAALWCNITALR
jgi:hypothetical protein